MLYLPCEPQSWPAYSPALWTDRPGTPSELPPSCPATPEPGPYEHDPAGRRKIYHLSNIQMGDFTDYDILYMFWDKVCAIPWTSEA